MPAPLKTFIIYASADREYRAALERQLKSLIDNGHIWLWSDKEILAGDVWDAAIKKKLLESELFLMLVSADFFNSDYIQEEEFSLALERLERGEAIVVPIIVRDCDWEAYEVIQRLQVLPSGGHPVTRSRHWGTPDEAWADVAREIRRLVVAHRNKQAEAEKNKLEKLALEQKAQEAAAQKERLEKEKIQKEAEEKARRDEAEKLKEAQERQKQREKEDAEQRRRELEAKREQLQNETIQLAWQQAETEPSPQAYRDFYQKYPDHALAREARHREKLLRTQDKPSFPWRWAVIGVGVVLLAFFGVWKMMRGGEKPPSEPAQTNTAISDDSMMFVGAGTFQMGSNEGESDEKPVHTVTVSDFYLGKYEVTVAEFRAFVEATGHQTDAEKENYSWKYTDKWEKMEGINWQHDAEGKTAQDNLPVVHISWNDATAYCEWLNKKTGQQYRLPTEAEWEYAAGNGAKHTKYSWGNRNPLGKKGGNVTDETKRPSDGVGWSTKFDGYNDGYWFTAPVGFYDPNDFGLYDMTGNVSEWCSDWYDADYYKNSPTSNPKGAASGSFRVFRGGSWVSDPQGCRVAHRYFSAPGVRSSGVGFRLARTK